MPAQPVVSLHSRRRSAIATPENIFPACTTLHEEKGANFTADDVIAEIGGGSKSTVGPIIQLWRHYQPLFEATQSLDETSAVQMVQTIDALLTEKTQRMDGAMKVFHEQSGWLITELIGDKEGLETTLAQARAENEALQAQVTQQQERITQRNTELENKARQQLELTSQLTSKNNELSQAQQSHSDKLEQLASEHTSTLTEALETQRTRLSAEHSAAQQQTIDTHKQALSSAKQQSDHAIAEKSERISSLEHALAQKTEDAKTAYAERQASEAAHKGKAHEYDAQIIQLNRLIEEKQRAFDSTNNTAQTLLDGIVQQLASNSNNLIERLDKINSATEHVNASVAGMSEVLHTITPPSPHTTKKNDGES